MSSLQQLETVILLLMAVLALTTIARKLVIPYPILLVIGGLALVFIPGLPVIHLDPDLVFLVFLPPILSAAAYVTSWRDFRANLRPITLHAVGLVLVTEVWTAHELVRPFLGTGVLGGYTTFSTYSVDVQQLVTAGSAGTALLYLAGTLAAALVAVSAGLGLARAAARRPVVAAR